VDWIPLVSYYKIPDEGFFTPHDFFAGGIFLPEGFFTPHDFFAGGIFLPEGFFTPHDFFAGGIFYPTRFLTHTIASPKVKPTKFFCPESPPPFLYLALGGSLKKKTTPPRD
jgi:hypothetical protein